MELLHQPLSLVWHLPYVRILVIAALAILVHETRRAIRGTRRNDDSKRQRHDGDDRPAAAVLAETDEAVHRQPLPLVSDAPTAPTAHVRTATSATPELNPTSLITPRALALRLLVAALLTTVLIDVLEARRDERKSR